MEGSTLENNLERLLEKFGLKEYYPAKIALSNVMHLGAKKEANKAEDVPWVILQKLVMLDFRARDTEIFSFNKSQQDIKHQSDGIPIEMTVMGIDRDNPLDMFLMIFLCCDLMLRQLLVQRMFKCCLAVPFLMPEESSEVLMLSLWALRSIVFEWRNDKDQAIENSLVSEPINIVSFVRVGRPNISKSKLMNNVLSDQVHDTFYHRDCPNGDVDRVLSDGLVEASFFIPSGIEDDVFRDVTMFLNLRGDAIEHQKQMQIMETLSNVMVVCIEISDLETPTVIESMRKVHQCSSKVVLLLSDGHAASLTKERMQALWTTYVNGVGKDNMNNTSRLFAFKSRREKNLTDLKNEIRTQLSRVMENEDKKAIHNIPDLVELEIDESDQFCKIGKARAERVISCMYGKSPGEIKEQMLPLQDLWPEWTALLKAQTKFKGNTQSTAMQEKCSSENDMTRVREKQHKIAKVQCPLMKEFIAGLDELSDIPSASYFLQCMKLHFDGISRETMPDLQEKYHNAWDSYKKSSNEFKSGKNQGENTEEKVKCLKHAVDIAEEELARASLGIEHLFREIGQFYEAVKESNIKSNKGIQKTWKKLPDIAAKLLLMGESLEVMDGDVSCVPLSWVKAVFASLKKLVGNKKVLTLSVLGIQSSGKSTLLNTMFGLQFAVSAGRCTRGVYMQLVKVTEGCSVPYDYVAVIDTEGLRAPELGHYNYSHDNELATFVVGIGDVTLINIKGENVSEIKDVLQIVVHAFLRMMIANKRIQKRRKCAFAHQNVGALHAKERMMYGCKKLKENLDEMTEEAASSENLNNCHTFNQVIAFDSDHHICYLSDLWKGDPPMAPVNPGYSMKVQELKTLILDMATKDQSLLITELSNLIEDMWNGILSDDFVYNFRNTSAVQAYSKLEKEVSRLKRQLRVYVEEWFDKVKKDLGKCSCESELHSKSRELITRHLCDINKELGNAKEEFEEFNRGDCQKDLMIEWKSEMLFSLQTFADELQKESSEHIDELVEVLKIDTLQRYDATEDKRKIKTRAMEVADTMRENDIDDSTLDQIFSDMWSRWMDQNCPKNLPPPIDFGAKIEKIVWKEYENNKMILGPEIEAKPLTCPLSCALKWSFTESDVEASHYSVASATPENTAEDVPQPALMELLVDVCRDTPPSRLQKSLSFVRSIFNEPEPLSCESKIKRKIVQIVYDIYKAAQHELAAICSRQVPPNVDVVKTIICLVQEGIRNHNASSETNGFTILRSLEVKLVVTACRYAIPILQKKHGEECVTAKIETYRLSLQRLFQATVDQCRHENVVAEKLCRKIFEFVVNAVEVQIPNDVVNYMLPKLGGKQQLIRLILQDLVEREDFGDLISYIYSAKPFALKWLQKHLQNELSGSDEDSPYIGLVNNISQRALQEIEATLNRIHSQNPVTVHKYLTAFKHELQIPFTAVEEEDFVESGVNDFEHFTKYLRNQFETVKERVREHFRGGVRPWSVQQHGAPHTVLVEKLWGCDAQCPFCQEPCQRSDAKHEKDLHLCTHHRPQGLTGTHWDGTDTLCTETCSFSVQSDECLSGTRKRSLANVLLLNVMFPVVSFIRAATLSRPDHSFRPDRSFRPIRKYNTHHPTWSIHPSPDPGTSPFWMWVFVKFGSQLAAYHGLKEAETPYSRTRITKSQAIQSLHEMY